VIIEKEFDENGEEILIYTAENDADLKEIKRMEEAGQIDTNDSFSDYRNKEKK
jgi:hypothetical protein